MTDDAPLIEATLAGRSSAFGSLVQKYQDRLYNTMVHVVGNAEDALDIVQEAFVQAFVKLDSFHRTSAFYTWLYRIAFNLAVSHGRKKRPRLSIDQARDALGREPIDERAGPLQQIEEAERAVLVRRAIESLGEEYRAVLVLREIEGCDYETIAEMLDLPVGTVRSRLHRARLQLREMLKEVPASEGDEGAE